MVSSEWVEGRVILPTSDVANVRRLFRNRYGDLVEAAYDEAKKFRAINVTSSKAKWLLAVETYSNKNTPSGRIVTDVAKVIADNPKAIKWSDFTTAGWSKPTVDTDSFPILSEEGEVIGKVLFSFRSLLWKTKTGRHMSDDYLDSPDSQFIYDVLDTIKWARATGGAEWIGSTDFELMGVNKRYGNVGKKAVNQVSTVMIDNL